MTGRSLNIQQTHSRVSSRPQSNKQRFRCVNSNKAVAAQYAGVSSQQTSRKLQARTTKASCQPRRQVVGIQCAAEPLKVMIVGAPAAGKGTQCAEIINKYGLVHISVGDLLRAEVKAGTPAGTKAKGFMDAGQLVPNEVVVEMVVSRLNKDDIKQKGWLLDGYPRSESQAAAIEKEGIRPDVFLVIDVPDELLIERVVGRRLDPETGEIYHMTFKPPPLEIADRLTQRSDDTEEKARTRLQVYKDNTSGVTKYYTDKLVTVPGDKPIDEVTTHIFEILDGIKK